MTSRERVLNPFARHPVDRIPCFSGMGNAITEGMRAHGIRFAQAQACITNGANAVWPGCDIWPTAPAENVRALVEATGRWWAFEQIAVHTPSKTFGG